MSKIILILLILLVLLNSFSFTIVENPVVRLLGHGSFFLTVYLLFASLRKWSFMAVDFRMLLACLIGSIGDIVLFLDLGVAGEFLQLCATFFVHLIFIITFQKEGAHIFKINNTNILKIAIPSIIIFFFFGFVLLNTLPNILFFLVIFYSVELTIMIVLGYYRPTKSLSYWSVSIGVTLILLRDLIYSFFFFIYHREHPLLYIPLYICNALGYILIFYGIALNERNSEHRKKILENFSLKFNKKILPKKIQNRLTAT